MNKDDSPFYDLGWQKPLVCRSSTDGYQAKFIVESGNKFLKLQCVLHGYMLKDPWVEVIASTLAKRLDIPCVMQGFASAMWRKLGYVGSLSNVFMNEFYSYSRMAELYGEDIRNSEYNSLPLLDKMEFLAVNMARYTETSIDIWRKYLYDMTLIDVLVGNTDRHFHNFGSFDLTGPALLFDCGMGMFVDAPANYNYDECMQQTYIQPWSEDPFDIISSLNLARQYPRLQWEDLIRLCPSENGRKYYQEVMKIVT